MFWPMLDSTHTHSVKIRGNLWMQRESWAPALALSWHLRMDLTMAIGTEQVAFLGFFTQYIDAFPAPRQIQLLRLRVTMMKVQRPKISVISAPLTPFR